MCCNPEDSWEELEPVCVMIATVVDLHDMSISLRSRRPRDTTHSEDLQSRGFAPPAGVSATTGMVRDVMRSYSANPGYRSACSAYLSSRSAPRSSVACTSTMSSPTSMRASGLAFRFQYQAGLSPAPAFEANTGYRSPSARYIMILVRGFPLRAPTVCSRTIGAPSNGPLTRPWLARNSAILRSLKSLPSLIVVSSHRLTSRTGPNNPLPDRQTLVLAAGGGP